jgi:hypothetical protein
MGGRHAPGRFEGAPNPILLRRLKKAGRLRSGLSLATFKIGGVRRSIVNTHMWFQRGGPPLLLPSTKTFWSTRGGGGGPSGPAGGGPRL